MKLLIILIVIHLFSFNSFSQSGYDNSALMNSLLGKLVKSYEDSSKTVVHAESGIFTISTSNKNEYTTRFLYPNNIYTIVLFTSTSIRDFKLRLWKKDDSNNWQRMDSANTNSFTTLNSSVLGDIEQLIIRPGIIAEYAFELVSVSGTNRTGRFGLCILKESKTDPPGKKNFSIDNYSVSEYNSTTQKYGDWSESKDYSCLFEVNAAETIVKQTASSGSASVYYIQDKNTDDAKWIKYKIRSDTGVEYKFMIPAGDGAYIRVYKTDNDNSPITDYHIRSKWSN